MILISCDKNYFRSVRFDIGNIILKLDVSIWVMDEELRLTLHAFRWEKKGGLKCPRHNSFLSHQRSENVGYGRRQLDTSTSDPIEV